MRYTRLEKFKKLRRRRLKKLFLLTIVMPCIVALLGYFAAAIIILPSMGS